MSETELEAITTLLKNRQDHLTKTIADKENFDIQSAVIDIAAMVTALGALVQTIQGMMINHLKDCQEVIEIVKAHDALLANATRVKIVNGQLSPHV